LESLKKLKGGGCKIRKWEKGNEKAGKKSS